MNEVYNIDKLKIKDDKKENKILEDRHKVLFLETKTKECKQWQWRREIAWERLI